MPSVCCLSVFNTIAIAPMSQLLLTNHTLFAMTDQRPKDACWKTWVTIQGWDIDITHFAAQHPGGSVITYFAGQDATAAFTEFHRCVPLV